jgi:hypothetical protein
MPQSDGVCGLVARAVALALATTVPAMAAEPADSAAAKDELAEVLVTGSRIQQATGMTTPWRRQVWWKR